MIRLEYNLKKDREIRESINYKVNTSLPTGYIFLQLQKESASQPLINTYPSSLKYPISQNNNFKFIANKTYSQKKFYFNYNNQFILFETDIRINDSIEFDGSNLIKGNIIQNRKFLRVFDEFVLKKSSQNVEFSEIDVDFYNSVKEELPYKMQEVRIFEGDFKDEEDIVNGNLLFVGYVDDYKLSSETNFREDATLKLSLLSPLALATKRYMSISGNYNTIELINLLFEPLINDGFTIKETNIVDKQMSVNYFINTIEEIANDLSNKLNFFWYIDEYKQIYLIDITSLFSQMPVISFNNDSKIKGLYSITPKIENNNYFNTINIKNARVYCVGVSRSTSMNYPTNYFPILNNLTLNTDDDITFNSPIDMSITGLETLCSEQQTGNPSLIVLSLTGSNVNYNIGYYQGQGTLELPNGVVFDDEDTDGATIILKRDSMFKNLITGFTWKGGKVSLTEIWSDCMLKYQVFRMTDSIEIEKCKGIISDSGIVESTVDVNEKWFTKRELIDYCRNLISSNNNQISELEMCFDEDYGFKVGDLINVNMPRFFIKSTFIITSIQETIDSFKKDFVIEMANSNITENYINLFRSSKTQEDDEKYDILNIVEYSNEEIVERYEVVE